MKIAIIGYGKMGKTIEQLARNRNHSISNIIDEKNVEDIYNISPTNTDIAIEFSQPDSAFQNIKNLLNQRVKVVAGTTGWLSRYDEVVKLCQQVDGTFLYASNFSIGVNLFFKLSRWLAEEMKRLEGFDTSIEEIHHTEKKDSPSGTAITIAEKIMEGNPQFTSWVNHPSESQHVLEIISLREPKVPGTHTVKYTSPLETIEIKHTAHDRAVFAEGVVKVSEWVANQKGVLKIEDYLNKQ